MASLDHIRSFSNKAKVNKRNRLTLKRDFGDSHIFREVLFSFHAPGISMMPLIHTIYNFTHTSGYNRHVIKYILLRTRAGLDQDWYGFIQRPEPLQITITKNISALAVP
jgi:hypothetical protein